MLRGFIEATLMMRDGFIDGALDLLKRHSGIVWDPGRFAGLLHGGHREMGGVMIGTFITSEGESLMMLRWIC